MELQLDLVASLICSFIMTLVLTPWLIPKLKRVEMVGIDLNKPERPMIPEMGGIAVVIGFFAGIGVVLTLDGVREINLLYVSLIALLGAAFVGVLDDVFGLRQLQKAFFPFLLALPLGRALDSAIFLPFIGEVDFGVLMIIAAPFAVTCAANAGNMLEGFNGLGCGLGIIMSACLLTLAFIHDRLDGIYILCPLLGALLAFLWFNKYPSRIFPGDTMMLFMGASIAVGGMLSALYIQTTVIFLPMITEFLLKMRGGFRAQNYSTYAGNGILEYHDRVESLTHILMKHLRLDEKRLVAIIWVLELSVCMVVISVDIML